MSPLSTNSALLHSNLNRLLDHTGYTDICTLDGTHSNILTINGQAIAAPIRLGAALDTLRTAKALDSLRKSYTIGVYTLKPADLELVHENTTIKLTDIEARLLSALAEAIPKAITRDTLLEEVWGYRPEAGIDTHTLETHIYRLRQKLDGLPALLITAEDGYSLEKI